MAAGKAVGWCMPELGLTQLRFASCSGVHCCLGCQPHHPLAFDSQHLSVLCSRLRCTAAGAAHDVLAALRCGSCMVRFCGAPKMALWVPTKLLDTFKAPLTQRSAFSKLCGRRSARARQLCQDPLRHLGSASPLALRHQRAASTLQSAGTPRNAVGPSKSCPGAC